ncbi:DUF998 domain-containing protein [Micromonospora sp. NPDC000089]|uniref:DUF998 domain-containing protein n=1 Tax=unclassified Micromonospora TaxID=2617518 RepID=UPI003674320B
MSPGRAVRALATAAFALAALLYASWLLGPVLNPPLGLTNGYASELAARDQPWHLLFGLGDVVAGALTVVAGLFLARRARGATRLAWLAAVVFGAATVFDGGLTSMDCSPSTDPRCARLEQLGGLSWRHEAHSISSAAAVAGGVVSMIALLPALRAAGLRRWAIAVLVLLLIGTAITLWEAVHPDDALGACQRVQLVGLSGWLLLAAAVAARTHDPARRAVPAGARHDTG